MAGSGRALVQSSLDSAQIGSQLAIRAVDTVSVHHTFQLHAEMFAAFGILVLHRHQCLLKLAQYPQLARMVWDAIEHTGK